MKGDKKMESIDLFNEFYISGLPLGARVDHFRFETDPTTIMEVYWGGLSDLVKADLEFPKTERWEELIAHCDSRYIESEFIINNKPDDVHMVTVIVNEPLSGGFIIEYGNYGPYWVKIADLFGYA